MRSQKSQKNNTHLHFHEIKITFSSMYPIQNLFIPNNQETPIYFRLNPLPQTRSFSSDKFLHTFHPRPTTISTFKSTNLTNSSNRNTIFTIFSTIPSFDRRIPSIRQSANSLPFHPYSSKWNRIKFPITRLDSTRLGSARLGSATAFLSPPSIGSLIRDFISGADGTLLECICEPMIASRARGKGRGYDEQPSNLPLQDEKG